MTHITNEKELGKIYDYLNTTDYTEWDYIFYNPDAENSDCKFVINYDDKTILKKIESDNPVEVWDINTDYEHWVGVYLLRYVDPSALVFAYDKRDGQQSLTTYVILKNSDALRVAYEMIYNYGEYLKNINSGHYRDLNKAYNLLTATTNYKISKFANEIS